MKRGAIPNHTPVIRSEQATTDDALNLWSMSIVFVVFVVFVDIFCAEAPLPNGDMQRLVPEPVVLQSPTTPFAMLAVIPSMPCEAPLAALTAVVSMLDRPVLTLLMEALALSAST